MICQICFHHKTTRTLEIKLAQAYLRFKGLRPIRLQVAYFQWGFKFQAENSLILNFELLIPDDGVIS